ncbi:MAG: DUF3343 domain-containing protein [Candidatus Adiutrix intracellularis]|jgi:hypothetical protein|nr:DUF3343 domain-containing protein [Candidatus Adiutrix intracellularis]
MESIITFSNTSSVMQGEEILLSKGVPVKIMARPIALGAECGFCLRLDYVYLAPALQALSQSALVPEGIFLKIEGLFGPDYQSLDRTF